MTEPTITTPAAPTGAPATPAQTTAPAATKGTLHLNPKPTSPEPVNQSQATQPVGGEESILDLAYKPDTPGEKKKYAGKYDSAEELEKAYGEAQKKISEGAPKVPETYALDKALETAGIKSLDASKHAEVFAQDEKNLKEAGVTAEQLPKLLGMLKQYDQRLQQAYATQYGPQANKSQEYAKLSSEWGQATDSRLAEVTKFAQTKLHPEVYKTLGKTAEGAKFIHELMTNSYGPVPMRSSPVAVADPLTLDSQIKEILTSKSYRNVHHPDHKAVTEQAVNLIKQQQQQQR